MNAAAAGGAARRAPAPASLGRVIAENLEALAIAIVMALVLKHFLIEAYKIPTGSMQPGIMGDTVVDISDRVLVNKLVYLLRDPERYEVVVFKNPLLQRQNFIKRLVGFGGERVSIRNGDLFVTRKGERDEHVARKPDAVWRAVRKGLLVDESGAVAPGARFQAESGAVRFEDDRVVLPSAGAAELRTREPIRDHYLDGYEPEWLRKYRDPSAPDAALRFSFARMVNNDVGDVEIAADVTPGPDAKSIAFEIREAGRTHRAELPIGEGKRGLVLSTTPPGLEPIRFEDQAADASVPGLRPGVTTRVSFRNVDDELVLELDGKVALRRPYVTTGTDATHDPKTHVALLSHASIQAEGSFTLGRLGLWRDIHYVTGGADSAGSDPITVPEGEVMVLGDNTQNSWDCRQWREVTYEVASPDGTKRSIRGNWFSPGQKGISSDSNPQYDGAFIEFRNVYGQLYRFAERDVVGDPAERYVHSIPRDYLLGKALAIFWPLPPASPSWRLKWVR